jgi:hypothetical protein
LPPARLVPFALAIVLVASAAQAQDTKLEVANQSKDSPVQFLISAGAGGGYELLGAEFALHLSHVEPFIGLGLGTVAGGFMGGARFVFHDEGSTPFLTLQGGRLFGGGHNGSDIPDDLFEVAALVGYRAQFGEHFFVNLALGPSVILPYWERYPSDNRPGVFFDGELALGVRF